MVKRFPLSHTNTLTRQWKYLLLLCSGLPLLFDFTHREMKKKNNNNCCWPTLNGLVEQSHQQFGEFQFGFSFFSLVSYSLVRLSACLVVPLATVCPSPPPFACLFLVCIVQNFWQLKTDAAFLFSVQIGIQVVSKCSIQSNIQVLSESELRNMKDLFVLVKWEYIPMDMKFNCCSKN